jgi:maltooligosyltrehalose trehalohydrolase
VALTGETDGYYRDFDGALPSTLENAYFHAGTWSSFRERTHGRPFDRSRISGHRFLAYLQNHDQIGNRAQGDRLSASISPARQLCGAALVMCSPYTPMLFMGEEWAASSPWQFFASFEDAALAEAVRTGRRKEFAEHGWGESEVPDPMDVATVVRSTLPWGELADPAHRVVFDTYRALIRLRREYPELADPRLDRFVVSSGDGWLVLHRGTLRVAVNLGSAPAVITLDRPVRRVLLGDPAVTRQILTLRPDTFGIVAT